MTFSVKEGRISTLSRHTKKSKYSYAQLRVWHNTDAIWLILWHTWQPSRNRWVSTSPILSNIVFQNISILKTWKSLTTSLGTNKVTTLWKSLPILTHSSSHRRGNGLKQSRNRHASFPRSRDITVMRKFAVNSTCWFWRQTQFARRRKHQRRRKWNKQPWISIFQQEERVWKVSTQRNEEKSMQPLMKAQLLWGGAFG